MESPAEFLERTSSAAGHLFAAIDSYMQLLRGNPVFTGSFSDEKQHKEAFKAWMVKNKVEIERGLAAEREFHAEKYALAILCGSILQVAATGIRLYSKNQEVPSEWKKVIKSNAERFCIGREVRGVPLGLVVYAARNQYNHPEDEKLREPSTTIFEKLATMHIDGKLCRDPAFDLKVRLRWNYPSNVISLLGWSDYEAYESDMRSLLSVSN